MYIYDLLPNGDIAAPTFQNPAVAVEVPKKTQGLKVLPHHYVFSTSHQRHYRSNIYIVKRKHVSLDTAYNEGDLKCFRAPTMAEGVATSGQRLYVLFESAASAYTSGSDKPDRVLKEIPSAARGDLPLMRP
jgi:hypothetical protein